MLTLTIEIATIRKMNKIQKKGFFSIYSLTYKNNLAKIGKIGNENRRKKYKLQNFIVDSVQ